MRMLNAAYDTGTAIVTMPPPPSAIGVALSQTGVAHSSLIPSTLVKSGGNGDRYLRHHDALPQSR
jgi:hypothetical protein